MSSYPRVPDQRWRYCRARRKKPVNSVRCCRIRAKHTRKRGSYRQKRVKIDHINRVMSGDDHRRSWQDRNWLELTFLALQHTRADRSGFAARFTRCSPVTFDMPTLALIARIVCALTLRFWLGNLHVLRGVWIYRLRNLG